MFVKKLLRATYQMPYILKLTHSHRLNINKCDVNQIVPNIKSPFTTVINIIFHLTSAAAVQIFFYLKEGGKLTSKSNRRSKTTEVSFPLFNEFRIHYLTHGKMDQDNNILSPLVTF